MRILFVSHRLPYAPNRGDRIRAYHLLRLLSTSHDVHLISLVHDEDEREHLGAMASLVSSVHPVPVPKFRNRILAAAALTGSRPLTHVLLGSRAMRPAIEHALQTGIPDVVFAYCTGIASVLFEPSLAHRPALLDMVDVDSEKWAELGVTRQGPMQWIYRREARTLRIFERRAMQRAAVTTVVSERERQVAERVLEQPAVVVPNGVDVEAWTPPGGLRAELEVVFCGVFNYAPNEEGALWLASHVWPIVKRQEPGARLKLVGMHPTQRILALAAQGSVEVTGAVPDIRPHVWQASVAVAPLWLARGTQNKVLEAVAGGLPCVVTPAVMDGLPDTIRKACVSAADAESFAAAIVSLLRQGATDHRRAEISKQAVRLSWSTQLNPFLELLEQARASAKPHGLSNLGAKLIG